MTSLISQIFTNKTVELPAYWRDYKKSNLEGVDDNASLSAIPFVVVDTESNSLDLEQNDILSMAAYTVENHQISEDNFECIVDEKASQKSSSDDALTVQRSLRSKISGIGISQKESVEKLVEFIGNNVVVGHHLGFDIALIERHMQKSYPMFLLNKCLDTAQLAYRLENDRFEDTYLNPDEYTLDAVATRYGVPLKDQDTAAGDAYITAQILIKLLKKAEEKGIKTLKDLLV